MHQGQAGTSTGATGMDVDQDPQEQETPLGTPFDDGFTPSTTRGYTSADPIGGVHTENLFTPLYTESQATDHANVNTNQQPPTPAATRDAEMVAASAAATDQAEASAAATNAEMEAADEMEAEAVAADAAELVAHLAAETEAAAAAEAAVAKATA